MKPVKEKTERALGVKLFLKPDRCSGPKCVMIRRPYRPGVHGGSRRRRQLSEYGKQLKEKQKIQVLYGLNNKQMRRLFKEPLLKIIFSLEKRLDRVVFLLGLAPSQRVARQLVAHGHIIVNSKKVTIPSYYVKIGDVIAVREESRRRKIFEGIEIRLKPYEAPSWLELNKDKLQGKCLANPKPEEINLISDLNLVGQFYSR